MENRKSRAGRPPKMSRLIIEQLTRLLESGNFIETSCAHVGIHKSTFYEWLRAGQLPGATRLQREFSDAIMKAEAEAEIRALAVIGTAAQSGDWKAAAWILERRSKWRWHQEVVMQRQIEINEAINRICQAFPAGDADRILRVMANEGTHHSLPLSVEQPAIATQSTNPAERT